MKMIDLRVLTIVLVFLSFAAYNVEASEKPTWDRYVDSTFQTIIDQHRNEVIGANIVTSTKDFPSRVTVVYLGKPRPLSKSRARFLDAFFTSINKPKTRALYESEVLVSEGKKQFWLPIQKDLVPYLIKEIKEGEQFIVFASWLGGFKEDGEFEWVFTINAFKSLP